MASRLRRLTLLLAVVAVPLLAGGTARAAIGPPWCGTPEPDAAENLPATQPGSFPHIPYYAIKCTLDEIQSRSIGGRMTVEQIGVSAQGRPMYLVKLNALETEAQQVAFQNWQLIRKDALDNPAKAQRELARVGDNFKIPIFIQGAIHGNEYEGVDADMLLIERLATTPHGTDPEVDAILDHVIVLINIDQNPDGRKLGQRANGFNFDLNRDFLTQSQSETKASVSIMQEWLPADMNDQHGYVTPTLVEATTKPHNPGIDYDYWLKWNQSRIDANEEAMNAIGMAITRPINDWCSDGDPPPAENNGICDDGRLPGPSVAEGWDDWGPFYTPMYLQLVGLNGSTVEMCNQTTTALCGVPNTTINFPRGRLGSRMAQSTVAWSTLQFDLAHRQDLMHDQLEIYRRGVTGAPRPGCCLPPFDVANNWMREYPEAYVIPLGAGQRSDPEANRLVEWLLFNGIKVSELKQSAGFNGQTFEQGSYVVWMQQAHRGLAETALGIGDDVSGSILILYAPPGAWSHGYLWGADVVTVPRGASFSAQTNEIQKPKKLDGGVESGDTDRYALEIDSATAVRTLNNVLKGGTSAELTTASFTSGGVTFPAGTVLLPSDVATRNALDSLGKDAGLTFHRVTGTLPAVEAIDRVPRIAVLANAIDQNVWSLRNLGFQADAVSTVTINTVAEDPLQNYDVIFNTAAYPSAALPTARTRITSFFANGGGYIGAGTNGGANFLTASAQLAGITAASRGGRGWSGIVYWDNKGGPNSPIVGTYPDRDTMIVDPPTWFTAVGSLTVDARLPQAGFFAAGLWRFEDGQSETAKGAALIAHGKNDTNTARITVFANNPLYRADPEREWPAVSQAAYWGDQ